MCDEKYSSKGLYPTPKFSLLSALVLVLVSFMIVGGCGGSSSGSSEDNNTTTCGDIDLADLHGDGEYGSRSWKCGSDEFLFLSLYFYKSKGEGWKTFKGYTQGYPAEPTLEGTHTLNNCNLSVDFWEEGVEDWEAEILSLDAHNMVLRDEGTNTIEHCS